MWGYIQAEYVNSNWTWISHAEEGKTPEQIAEEIAAPR